MVDIISRFADLRIAGLGVGLWLVIACGPPDVVESPRESPPPTPPAAEAAVTIVVLGDSLAAGLGLPEGDAFPALVEHELASRGHSVRVVNAGVSGDTTAGGLSRLEWLLSQKPQILVVELGGNDALRGQPLENTETNLREIVRGGLRSGAEVLLLGMDVPTNLGPEYTAEFAALYERIANEEGVTLVPGFVREVGLDPALLQADGLHPTAEGHRRLAETLLPHVEALLLAIEAG